MRIGIYGGSFDPVHFGHVNVARTAVEDLSLDRLLVIPANISPFKTGGGRGTFPYPWSRLDFIRAAFAAVEKAEVDDRELVRGGVSYAIDTVRELRAEIGDGEYFFIIGEDSAEGLDRWKDIDELKKLVTFKTYPRTAESSSEIRRLFSESGVKLNPDGKTAGVAAAGVLRKNGYCPCRLNKERVYFCPCDEFKGQLADPDYHGLCHCRLYLKP